MKDNSGCFAVLLGIVLGAIAILISKWIFETVMATDWPDWVKFMILTR